MNEKSRRSLLHKSFWLFAFLLLLSAQVQLVSPFQHFSYTAEVSQPPDDLFSSSNLTPTCDLDDCSDLLQTALPLIAPASESWLPAQQFPARLQLPAMGVSFPYLSRPPPVLS